MSDSIFGSISVWAQSWAGVAWPILVNSLIIGCLVAIAARLARRCSAAFRYGLWLLVLVRLILPPGLGVSVAASARDMFDGTSNHAEHVRVALNDDMPGAPVADTSVSNPAITVGTEGSVASLEDVAAASLPPKTHWRLSWITLAFVVWLTGALVSAMLVMWRLVRLRRQLRELEPVEPGPVSDLFECCKKRMLRSSSLPCELFVSDSFASPAVTGLWGPKVILPRYLADSLTETELEPLILHELAHVRRRDIAINWLQIILQILHWPNPVIWLANARLRTERELACDDCVLAVTDFKRRDYGSGLVKVLEVSRQRPAFSMGLFSVSGGNSQVMEHRLRRIMDKRNAGVVRLSLPALAGLLLLAVACLAPTVAPADKEPALPAEKKDALPAEKPPVAAGKKSIWSALFAQGDESRSSRHVTISRAVDKDGKLSVQSFNGAIVLSAWDQPSAKIDVEIIMKVRGGRESVFGSEEKATQYFEQIKADVSGNEKDLVVRTVIPERRRRVSVEAKYDVKVPASVFANLKTSNGAVTASGLANGLNAESSNGKIEVEQVSGPVTARTSNGAIRCGKITGSVDTHTSNGAIEIDHDGFRQSDGELKAHTSNGAIRVTLPRNSAFDVNARTSNGQISSEFPVTIQGQFGGKSMSGKVNGGGAQVNLETSNGKIEVNAKGEVKLEAVESGPGRDDARVLAARDECFPEEVCKAILELKEQGLQKLDPERTSRENMHIVSLDRNSDIWWGTILQRKNTGDTLTGDYTLSNTDAPEPIIVMDETGAVLKHRRLMRKPGGPGQFELIVSIDKPWPANETKQFLWIGSGGQSKGKADNHQQVSLQNIMGPEGIQQLVFVRPKGFTIESQSEPAVLTTDQGEREVFLWQKHVKQGENYRVDAVLDKVASGI